MPLGNDQLDQARSPREDSNEQALLANIVPASELSKFHLEQRNEDVLSFKNEQTGRYLHMTPEGDFLNHKGEPISQEQAVTHALGHALDQEHQHKTREPRDLSVGF